MTHIVLNQDLAKTLKDRVIVLTGGSTGIGRAAVELFHSYGAKVMFGDVNDELGKGLATQLGSSVEYRHCNATSYADQLALFAEAEKAFGKVDVVCANAGVGVHADIFAPDADWQTEPSMIEIDVNLKGVLFSARIGMGYLRKNGGGDLILTSSIAGWKECSHLVTYTASKHGVIGFMRGLYQQAWEEKITVNVLCPWMTKTRMVLGIEVGWRKLGLPENEAIDVARAMVICASANRGPAGQSHGGAVSPFTGKILHIAGGEAYEIEDNIQRLEPQWLGESNSAVLAKGQAFLADPHTSWDADAQKTGAQVGTQEVFVSPVHATATA
ncbi:Tropinone -like 1 [Cyphellophora attinorum]|uniref:Tropinone-like 1 n=1 Tax=Cyphellophora attinorum TaxID=1664694 RepID=A0A0N1HBQ7_9EURO|nr:Tropinone -like 1 [Phialophora attinorum]KPI41537.1 Tropinone -like 1 [Phialophora attinorum]